MSKRSFSLQLAAISWLLLVSVVTVLALRQGPLFDSSIMALLPKSDRQPLVQNATEQMAERFSKRLILLLAGANEEKVRTAVGSLAESLTALPETSSVVWRVDDNEIADYQTELFPYRFSVIDTGIRKLSLSGDYKLIKDRALLRLYSPLSVGKSSIIEDPFGLFPALSLNRYGGLNLDVSQSLLKVTGTELPTYMLMVTLAGDPFSPQLQSKILDAVAAKESQLNQSGVTVSMSGMLLHAAAGAQQAKTEISTIGLGSLLGIIITMLLIFRQFKPLILMLFPVAIGCITAAAVTMLIFGRVHLVTFAFGAGLVGVSIDYALHFLCERRVSSSGHILRKILPGLLLGLLSSVIAYAAQALAPFPGLRQMAVFSVVGLSASWLTVVLWFPLLTHRDSKQPLAVADKLDGVRKRFPRIEGNPVLIMLLLITTVVAASSLWNSRSQDDIRLLQTSPTSLLAQEQSVQKTLGISSSSQFLLISADTLEQCLQKEELLIPRLEKLQAAGLLSGYQAVSSVLPSMRRQAENVALMQRLYDQQLTPFYGLLKVSASGYSDARLSLERAEKLRLTPDVWQQQQGSESWKDLIVKNDESAATVIRLSGALDDEVRQKLMAISDTESGVSYIDQVQNISELMGTYRSQIIQWVMMAYLCVLLILLLRYKTQVWRVVMPPLLASVITLAVLVQLEQGINLFHLMALILVLGIGLDMGIFLMETGEAAHTWLAVSLSTYTSLLAFGLLALSDTPVLHHFGLTVLIGLALVWLLAPLMRKDNSGDIHS
ncbi:MAG: MMPL family transporter [Amphritea sp.]